ncbi:MAG: hypothetical protein GF317_01435 [Candidatus Lokiarchaeota archaeon]|nr:hypothetical protein [Candidatus Lokiarchaeota archaeon]MBD3198606.1 hypothetical protein [Candidatus Lokiarchaeota archaeon]
MEKNCEIVLQNSCPECNSKILIVSHEKICSNCGLVIDKVFQETSYTFDDSSLNGSLNKQYVALGKRTDFVGGLGSFIGYEKARHFKDISGNLINPNGQKLFRRLKKNYSQFIRIKDHETEYRIFNILNKISIFLDLNKNIRHNAAYYYKKIIKSEEKVINNISLIAFCIFFAARKENHNAPININEISKAFQNFGHRVNPRLILRDGLKYKNHLAVKSEPHQCEDYLNRLISEVISHEIIEKRLKKKGLTWSIEMFKNKLTLMSRKILTKLTKWKRGGRNPFILTGAVIYLADKLLAEKYNQKSVLTQKLISEATDIAEYSIRDHYVNLLKPLFMQKQK